MSRLVGRDLRFRYVGASGNALDGAHLEVEPGTVHAVLGPSGCGKTTLLRSIAGLERVEGGVISLGERTFDAPGVHVPTERRRIGLVPQEGALFPHLDVAGNLAFGLRALDRSARAARVDEMLELIGLPGHGSRRPDELSGGQQQRVALGRALAPQPDAVLLDEPFSSLDAALRTELGDDVAELLRATRTTAVLVTHDRSEALGIADSLTVMREGRTLQSGTPESVYRSPVDLFVADFLGDTVVLPGPADVVRVCRPEQLRSVEDATPNGYDATVVSLRFEGRETAIDLELDGSTVTLRRPSVDLPAPGDRLRLRVDGPVLEYPTAA